MSIGPSQSALRTTSILPGVKSRIACDLVDVGSGVGLDLLLGEGRAGGGPTGRVADPGGEVPDDEHRDVAEILELAQLAQDDREPEVDVGRSRVDAQLHPQRATGPSFVRSSGSEMQSTAPAVRIRSCSSTEATGARYQRALGRSLDARAPMSACAQ